MRSSSAQGFTLIELIVAIGLASIVLTALLSFFTIFIGHQVRAQDERVALETVRFLFAELSRETYFGYDYTCGQVENDVCSCLIFKDQLGRQVKIWYDRANKQVKRATKLFDPNPNVCSTADKWVPFTDNSVSVTSLSFELENDVTKQPRVQARIDAEYALDGNTENVSFKTQITSRILEPSQNVLNTFIAASENENASIIHNFVYGPKVDESGQYLDSNDNPTTREQAQIVCRDRAGNTFPGFCEEGAGIVAAEFTNDGLYILGDNGLLFHIPQTEINDALTATGAANSRDPVYRVSSGMQSAIVRVLGKFGPSTCRFCVNDPQGVVSIHPAGEYLYTRSHDGALHRVDNAIATRIVEGGTNKETVRNIDIDNNRVLLFYRDGAGARTVRLFSANTLVSSDDIEGGCREFEYVPNNIQSNRCRQLHPDPNKENSINITPSDITGTSLSFRFLDTLQVINNTVSLWYRDAAGRHLVSIGQGASKLKRSDAVARGGVFAYGNGLNKYTSICNDGTNLCIIDTITDTTPTTIQTSGTSPLADHLHFRNLPIAINKEGRLLYFNGVQQGSTATAISIYNYAGETTNSRRILCDAAIEDNEQVTFKNLSEKHPNKEIVAAVGTSLVNGYVDEIYLLEPTTSAKKQYSGNELNIVCDEDHIERYHLPATTGPAGGLDLVRLHGLEFREKDPSTQ